MPAYSNVPLVGKKKKCPLHTHHNALADEANKRLSEAGPDTAWRIFYYADSIFTGMRNTATPMMPLGVNPPEDEWWKIYMGIEYPTASTGEGNWPLTLAGTPEGANVMNPLNAYIFGRVTSENKQYNMGVQGPWAEGNIFDGAVESARSTLSNRNYFESSFRQRGAVLPNEDYSPYGNYLLQSEWSRYLANPKSPFFLSQGLFAAGRQVDRYFREYASNTVYMRYAPSRYSGGYRRNPWESWRSAPQGVLKRKNAAKDLLHLSLWSFLFYFRGSEAQRSLFCDGKAWSVPITEFTATNQYLGESTFGAKEVQTNGPLTICDVGFDFFKYYTRQNILAPTLGTKLIGGKSSVLRGGFFEGSERNVASPAMDGTGNPKVEQYRPKFTFSIMQGPDDGGKQQRYLGNFNPDPVPAPVSTEEEKLFTTKGKGKQAKDPSGLALENYDDLDYNTEDHPGSKMTMTPNNYYGKTLRLVAGSDGDNFEEDSSIGNPMLMKCSYDNGPNGSTRLNQTLLNYKIIPGYGKAGLTFVLAGYYLQTNAIENPNMQFKLRVWAGTKKVHEAIIKKHYSYAVNRSADKAESGKRGYVFNRMHYFKKGVNSSSIRFEIIPIVEDRALKRDPVRYTNYKGEETPSAPKIDKNSYEARYKYISDKKYDRVISFGNPFSGSVEKESDVSDSFYADPKEKFLYVPKTVIDALNLTTGDAVKIKYVRQERQYYGNAENEDKKVVYSEGGFSYFVRVEPELFGTGSGGDVIQEEMLASDKKTKKTYVYQNVQKVYFFKRRDKRLNHKKAFYEIREEEDDKGNVTNITEAVMGYDSELPREFFKDFFKVEREQGFSGLDAEGNGVLFLNPVNISKAWSYSEGGSGFVLEKMEIQPHIFKVDLEPVILLRQRPSFHDAYALLRAATAKQNRSNFSSNIILGDAPGVGTVGHHFNEGNKIFKNYIKYGSGENIFGSSVVPVLRMYVSANPIYESIRKFVGSYLRFADRKQLVSYTVEGGRGVLYFKRYPFGLARKFKATIFRNMEPDVEPVGYFNDKHTSSLGHTKYKPIEKGESYGVMMPVVGGIPQKVQVTYSNGSKQLYSNGAVFEAPYKGYVSSNPADPYKYGVFEYDGITKVTSPDDGSGKVSNEWIMFLTSGHYHPATSNIYKPSIYNDIMGFLNNRCHHRSKEYERRHGDKYDMIRTELCRVSHLQDPGPRLNIFLSKSSSNLTYIFNTNNPISGNLNYYTSAKNYVTDYRNSCPATTKKPYKIRKTTVVNSLFQDMKKTGFVNPSAYRTNNMGPSQYIRVELDRPLDGTGRLNIGASGWEAVDTDQLQAEPYRTDENAIVEYLFHYNYGRSNYNCKRLMVGDYAADTDAVFGSGYRHFGACFPRFYFLKLIPKVSKNSLLDTEPYAQMDFYFRAMCGAFVNPYRTFAKGVFGYAQDNGSSSQSWKFTELASRSSEEDPAQYAYVSPGDISLGEPSNAAGRNTARPSFSSESSKEKPSDTGKGSVVQTSHDNTDSEGEEEGFGLKWEDRNTGKPRMSPPEP